MAEMQFTYHVDSDIADLMPAIQQQADLHHYDIGQLNLEDCLSLKLYNSTGQIEAWCVFRMEKYVLVETAGYSNEAVGLQMGRYLQNKFGTTLYAEVLPGSQREKELIRMGWKLCSVKPDGTETDQGWQGMIFSSN